LIVERSATTDIFAGKEALVDFCVMLFRDMFLLKGDAAEGAGELALNESFRLRATDCLRSSSSFLEITSLTLGATNLFDLSVLRLFMAIDIAFPPEHFLAFVTGEEVSFVVDGSHVSIQICLCFKSDPASGTFEGAHVIVDRLDVAPEKTSFPESPTTLVALEVAFLVVNSSHVHVDVMFASKLLIAFRA